jgi:hypothetical protein
MIHRMTLSSSHCRHFRFVPVARHRDEIAGVAREAVIVDFKVCAFPGWDHFADLSKVIGDVVSVGLTGGHALDQVSESDALRPKALPTSNSTSIGLPDELSMHAIFHFCRDSDRMGRKLNRSMLISGRKRTNFDDHPIPSSRGLGRQGVQIPRGPRITRGILPAMGG